MQNNAPNINDEQPLLRIENLAVSFGTGTKRLRAVNGVSYAVYPRQTLAVVGESGCGKSVSSLSTLQLVPTPPGHYDHGHVWWTGSAYISGAHRDPQRGYDLLTFNERQMRSIRGNDIAMIFQEPMTSLNPVYTIGEQILEAILLHQKVNRKQAVEIAVASLTDVDIASARDRMKEYPHQLSGGMRQRVMIAMALACQPMLLLADEPTTALDVTIQAQILELLRELQQTRNMGIVLITHDLGVVAENADVVAVMYAGRVVEYGSVLDVFSDPLHPYTHGLFASMPVVGRTKDRLSVIEGQVPNLSADAREFAVDKAGNITDIVVTANPTVADVIMRDGQPTRVFRPSEGELPPLREVKPSHWVACYDTPGYAEGRNTLPDLNFRREHALAVES